MVVGTRSRAREKEGEASQVDFKDYPATISTKDKTMETEQEYRAKHTEISIKKEIIQIGRAHV